MHRAASRTPGRQWGALSGRLFALVYSCALVFVLVLAQLLFVARFFLGLRLPRFPVWCRQSPGAGQGAVRRSRPCPACTHTSQHERRAYQLCACPPRQPHLHHARPQLSISSVGTLKRGGRVDWRTPDLDVRTCEPTSLPSRNGDVSLPPAKGAREPQPSRARPASRSAGGVPVMVRRSPLRCSFTAP